MTNFPRVLVEERLFYTAPESSGKKLMLRLEQKPLNWMIEAVLKVCKAVELVMDTCAGTQATGRPSLQLSLHHLIIGCEKGLIAVWRRYRQLWKFLLSMVWFYSLT